MTSTADVITLTLAPDDMRVVMRALDRLGTPAATALLLRLRDLVGDEVHEVQPDRHEDTGQGLSTYGIPLVVCRGRSKRDD